jgi:secreted Zn-dependent insulinase-like peptidase
MSRCSACPRAAAQCCPLCAAPFCSRACYEASAPHSAQCAIAQRVAAIGAAVGIGITLDAPALLGDEQDVSKFAFAQPLRALARDPASYRLVRLRSNGLRVLACSDVTRARSVASLDLGVGSNDDPRLLRADTPYSCNGTLQGLSHLVEHLLFMGTRTHPSPDAFGERIAAAGGDSNAYTSDTTTNFHFAVLPASFDETLQHFGEFFREPLLDRSVLEREVGAVDAEHAKNLASDERRLHRLATLLAGRSFSTGCCETLLDETRRQNVDLYGAARAHAAAFYADASTMRLVVAGPQSLDALCAAAERAFGGVATRERESDFATPGAAHKTLVAPRDAPLAVRAAVDAERALVRQMAQTLVRVRAAGARRFVSFAFALPPLHRCGVDVLDVLDDALCDEAPGSLAAWLRANELGSAVQTRTDVREVAEMQWHVQISLTARGCARVREIYGALLSFLAALAASPSAFGAEALAERAACARLGERFGDAFAGGGDLDAAVALAVALRARGTTLLEPRRACTRDDLLQVLARIDRLTCVRAFLVTPDELAAPQIETEHFYAIDYTRERLVCGAPPAFAPPEFAPIAYDEWRTLRDGGALARSVAADSEFSPPKEAFSPLKARGAAERVLGRGALPFPEARAHGPRLRAWVKRDAFFGVPRATAHLALVLPPALYSVERSVAARVYVQCAATLLGKTLARRGAARADARAALRFADDCILLSAAAYCAGRGRTMLGDLVVDALDALRAARDATPAQLASALAQVREALHARLDATAYERAFDAFSDATTVGAFTARACASVAPESVLACVAEVARVACVEAHAEMLLHGNIGGVCARDECERIAAALARDAGAGASAAAWPALRTVALRRATRHVYALGASAAAPGTACVVALQAGLSTPLVVASLDLLVALVAQTFYDVLRTREQLGYVVQCTSRHARGASSLLVVVQSRAAPAHLEARIEAALASILGAACEDTPERRAAFESTRAALLYGTYGHEYPLDASSDAYFGEILGAGRAVGFASTEPPPLPNAATLLASEDARGWEHAREPLFDRRFYKVAALAQLSFEAFCAFVRALVSEKRRALAVHVGGASSVVGEGTRVIREGAEAEFHRSSYVYPLIMF